MLLKQGVNMLGLQKPIRGKLAAIDALWQTFGEREAVCTSALDGEHSANSLHYQGLAIDLRLPRAVADARAVTGLKDMLGKGYDVVLETDHIHVEYDPK